MPGGSSKSGHKSGHKSSRESKSGSGSGSGSSSSKSSKSRRGVFEFKVEENPSSMIQRNDFLNPYPICSLTTQGVDDLPEVDQMSAVAMLVDMSGATVTKGDCIKNYNVSAQEVVPGTTEEGGSASGSSGIRYCYFYFNQMIVDAEPGDYYFVFSLYDWSSGDHAGVRATANSTSFSVV